MRRAILHSVLMPELLLKLAKHISIKTRLLLMIVSSRGMVILTEWWIMTDINGTLPTERSGAMGRAQKAGHRHLARY